MHHDDTSVRDTVHPRRARRWWLWGGLAVAIAAGGTWFVLRPAKVETSRFHTQLVERGDLDVTVTAVGTLQPLDEVTVSSELSGIVRRVLVEANDTVRQGQVLAELDTQILTAQARESHALVEAMQASLQSALIQAAATARRF